ncbi:hypothetical protein Bbelb_045600 [Branchiostoma belcheri]|nr:hypothetical protein Bbelb_045600 [Branchiostoma belcheri]
MGGAGPSRCMRMSLETRSAPHPNANRKLEDSGRKILLEPDCPPGHAILGRTTKTSTCDLNYLKTIVTDGHGQKSRPWRWGRAGRRLRGIVPGLPRLPSPRSGQPAGRDNRCRCLTRLINRARYRVVQRGFSRPRPPSWIGGLVQFKSPATTTALLFPSPGPPASVELCRPQASRSPPGPG